MKGEDFNLGLTSGLHAFSASQSLLCGPKNQMRQTLKTLVMSMEMQILPEIFFLELERLAQMNASLMIRCKMN